MRRKLFFCTLLLIIFVAITTSIQYKYQELSVHEGQRPYIGKISSIESEKDKAKLVVKTTEGDKILLSYYGNNPCGQKLLGKVIAFDAELSTPKGQTNPGCFDYRLYLKSIGIDYVGTTQKIVEIKADDNIYDRYCRLLMMRKETFLNSFEDEDTRTFIEGILFGNADNLDEDIYDQFKTNGTAHILAVSGLHIGIIYELIQKVLGRGHGPFKAIAIVMIMLSIGIVMGWTPSVTRAIGMILMKMYAQYFDKRYDSLTSISFIAILMILANPYVIYNVSFQMSFLAVASIIFINPHIPSKIPDFLSVIISVNIGLLAYQSYQFNSFSVTSLVANIPVVYLAGVLLPITFFQFALFMFTGQNLAFIEYIVRAMADLVILINRIYTFGQDGIEIISPQYLTLLLIYILGGFILSETFYILCKRKKLKIIITLIVLTVTCTAAYCNIIKSDFDDAEVVFVDVGQGACVHIKEGNKNILIDGGGKSDYKVGSKILKPYLLKNGVSNVDLAIATHRHTDHFKGLEELEEEGLIPSIEVGLSANRSFKVSEDVYIETLWPLTDEEAVNQEENKNCSVFMLYYEDKKILITGDLDSEGEAKMLEEYGMTNKLEADVMQVGHHGSQYSTSDEFLEAVNPMYCVIQVGKNNYGHPHTKIIEKLKEKCIIILRNDIHGAVGFSLDGNNIEYYTMS